MTCHHGYVHTHAHTHAHMHAHTHTHSHTHAHTLTRTHAHTHTHTHTHTHLLPLPPKIILCTLYSIQTPPTRPGFVLLLQKLQGCLTQLEQFPVKLHDHPNRRYAPSIKLHITLSMYTGYKCIVVFERKGQACKYMCMYMQIAILKTCKITDI